MNAMLNSVQSMRQSACPGGETGRRTGLKIPSSERNVPVRFRSRAPQTPLLTRDFIEPSPTRSGPLTADCAQNCAHQSEPDLAFPWPRADRCYLRSHTV
jgi:hypothetical protein